MKSVVESIGKVASRTVIGGHELVFDQPANVPGGEDRGPSPLDVMTVAVGACAHYFAAAYLHARGMSPDGLTVEVESQKERVPVSRVGKLALKVHLPKGVDHHHAVGIERAIKNCPAYGTLLHPPDVEISIERDDAAAGQASSAG